MKLQLAVMCFALFLSLHHPLAFAGNKIDAPADVKAIVTIETINAVDLNMARVAARYAPNAVVYDLGSPGVYKGHDQIVAGFGPQLRAMKSITGTLPSVTVHSDGTMACAATQMKLNLVTLTGAKITLSLRQIDAFRKFNGTWLIEQQHASFPTDPRTGMSLMNAPVTVPLPPHWGADPLAASKLSVLAAKAGIRAWAQKFATASTVDELLATLSPGNDGMIFDMFSPAPLQGAGAIGAAYGPSFARTKSVTVTFIDFRADSDATLGVQIDTQKMVLKMKDGSTVNRALRQSDCLHYVRGKWYSFFDELSFPADTKTGKAVMN